MQPPEGGRGGGGGGGLMEVVMELDVSSGRQTEVRCVGNTR